MLKNYKKYQKNVSEEINVTCNDVLTSDTRETSKTKSKI